MENVCTSAEEREVGNVKRRFLKSGLKGGKRRGKKSGSERRVETNWKEGVERRGELKDTKPLHSFCPQLANKRKYPKKPPNPPNPPNRSHPPSTTIEPAPTNENQNILP